MNYQSILAFGLAMSLGGCAELQFAKGDNADAFTFYNPVPLLVITYSKDCSSTAALISVPDVGDPRSVKPKSGFGSANLTVAASNGMISSIGQQTDTGIPATITALGSVATAAGGLAALAAPRGAPPAPAPCSSAPAVKVYQIVRGTPPQIISFQPVPLP